MGISDWSSDVCSSDLPNVASLRATGGWRISPRLNLTGDLSYERAGRHDRVGVFLSLVFRLDRASSLRSDYDSRNDRKRLTYQTYRGSGTGAYNFKIGSASCRESGCRYV